MTTMAEGKKWLLRAILVDDGISRRDAFVDGDFLSGSVIMDELFKDLPAGLTVDKYWLEEVTDLETQMRTLP